MKMYKLIIIINKIFGYLFFKNYNIFTYNFFDLILQKKNSKKIKCNFVKNFVNDGYQVLDTNYSEFVKKINSEIKSQDIKINKNMFSKFDINNNLKEIIKDFVNNQIITYLEKIKKYFNSDIYVTNINLRRNFYSPQAKENELYNNFYHNDSYVYTHFKLFVNLMDMDEDYGPTHIFTKKETKEVIGNAKNYKRNNFIENINSKIKPYKHIGPKGKSCFCFTSQCLHKAGIPTKDKYRDYLIITFVAYPNNKNKNMFCYEDNFNDDIWNGDTNKLTTSLAKPYTIKELFNLYKNFN
jgi:CRISPR/Cas system-associated protein endoribonuclease Cas2